MIWLLLSFSTEDLVGASEVPPEVVMTSHVEAVGASGKLDHDDLNLGAEGELYHHSFSNLFLTLYMLNFPEKI